MLVAAKKTLGKANRGNYAVGAFNIYNMESVQAILEGAERLKAPVILQTTESAIHYAGLEYLISLINAAGKTKASFTLHLDHGRSFEIIKKCITAGYKSVMFDGADLPYAENIRKTKKVVQYAHKRGVWVEAELGEMMGVEDNIDSARFKYTNPEEAKEFVEKTGCDCLAASIGNAHGAFKYKVDPHIDVKRLKAIKAKAKIPLVLHGGSAVPQDLVTEAIKYGAHLLGARGIPDSIMRKLVKNGINKVNIDTDIRLAFHVATREFLTRNPEVFDPRKVFGTGRKMVAELVMHKIKLFGSAGKG